MTYYTYAHFRESNGDIFYIGKGMGNRAWQFGLSRSEHWRRVAKKNGCLVEILATWPTEQDAYDHEKFLISTFRSMGANLVNVSAGGDGVTLDAAGIARRAATLRKTLNTPECRKKISEGVTKWLAVPGNRELKATAIRAAMSRPDVVAKKAAALEQIRANPIIQARRIESLRKSSSNPEYRDKKRAISIANKNMPPVYRGAFHPMAKAVRCIETQMEFVTAKDAAKWIMQCDNVKGANGAIARCCKGTQKSAYGFHWEYVCY